MKFSEKFMILTRLVHQNNINKHNKYNSQKQNSRPVVVNRGSGGLKMTNNLT